MIRVAYLVNQYPRVSHSFIRREILALEGRGLEVQRIALRGWDDALVVVTKWQNGQSWLDRAGNHASSQLTVTERFRLLDPGHIAYEATLDDPQTYTRPWTIEMPLYRLIDPQAQLLEHKCVPFADQLLYRDLLQKDGTRERR